MKTYGDLVNDGCLRENVIWYEYSPEKYTIQIPDYENYPGACTKRTTHSERILTLCVPLTIKSTTIEMR